MFAFTALFALSVLGALFALAACATDDDGDFDGATEKKTELVLTAQAFELEGENTVDNFKLHWNAYENADYYRLYRSTSRSGSWREVIENKARQKIPGTMYDVYDAGSTTYYYKVVAYNAGNKVGGEEALAQSQVVRCEPYTDTTSDVFDNTVQSIVHKPIDEIVYDGKYWRYIYNRVDNAVWYEEQWSQDGYPDSEWTSNGIVISGNPANLADGTADARYCEYLATSYNGGKGCKLESTSWHVKGDLVINWSHYENGADYSLSQVICIYGTPGSGLLQARCAPYQPNGIASRDLICFEDTDGSAYLIGSTSVQTCHKLAKNWLDLDKSFTPLTLSSASREAPCIVKHDGYYYLFSSESAGWYPTQGAYQSGASLLKLVVSDAAEDLHAIGNRTTFGAQSGQVEKIGSTYYMLANRWSQGWRYPDPAIPLDSYLGTSGIAFAQRMLPITFSKGYAFYDYYPLIKYDYAQGLVVPVQKGKLLSIGRTATRSTTANSDYPASNAVDGVSHAALASSPSWGTYNGYALKDNAAYSFVVALDNEAYITEVDVTFRNYNGSESASQYTIDGSHDGTIWTTLKDRSDNYIIGFNENIMDSTASATKYRYVRVNVTGIHDVNHNTSGAWWTAGIHECSVYGYEAEEAQ